MMDISWLVKIVEDHVWYPISLLYMSLVAFAIGFLISYLL
jgi:hypothetical protein